MGNNFLRVDYKVGDNSFGGSIAQQLNKLYIARNKTKKESVIANNTCMICGKKFSIHEVRIVPPQVVQEQDPYVRDGIVASRCMCENCYESMASQARESMKRGWKGREIIKNLVKIQ
ncbi:MAG: hypothetical protein ACP5RT_01865 [Candidatus Micrarchaeia archaeon]